MRPDISGWYVSSTSNIDSEYRETIAHIEGLPGIRPVALDATKWWCLDNSVYTGKFTEDKWLKRIKSLEKWYEKCAFITIPDVIQNCKETITQFYTYRSMVKSLPVAFVSQDGIVDFYNQIPWDDFDCLFVGGSNSHKFDGEAEWIIGEARSRGKWIHVGRVNSRKRMNLFWYADSWDGTTLSYGPSKAKWIHESVLLIREKKGLQDALRISVPSGNCISEPV